MKHTLRSGNSFFPILLGITLIVFLFSSALAIAFQSREKPLSKQKYTVTQDTVTQDTVTQDTVTQGNSNFTTSGKCYSTFVFPDGKKIEFNGVFYVREE